MKRDSVKLTEESEIVFDNFITHLSTCDVCKIKNSKKQAKRVFYNSSLDYKEIMIIMQNPGVLKPKEDLFNKKMNYDFDYVAKKGIEYVSGLDDKNNLVSVTRNSFYETVKDFFNFKSSNDFKNNVFITDLVKCSGSLDGDFKGCGSKFLKDEIKYVKPRLILAIGRSSWSFLVKNYSFKNNPKISDNVTKIHGTLFESESGFFVIPLAHFGNRISYLRDSYSFYLGEGLNNYSKLKSVTHRT